MMIRFNTKFATDRSSWRFAGLPLDAKLASIAEHGFVKTKGAWLFRALRSANTHLSVKDFPDMTGYECFLNSIHVDDYVQEHVVEQGLLFLDQTFDAWRRENPLEILNGIASIRAPDSMVVKIHFLRSSESTVSDQLDDYLEEAMIVVDSRETGITSMVATNAIKGSTL